MAEIMTVPLTRPRPISASCAAMTEFAEHPLQGSGARAADEATVHNTVVDIDADGNEHKNRRPARRAGRAAVAAALLITFASITGMLIFWEIFGRQINPVFGSYQGAIAVAFWDLLVTGQLWAALSTACGRS